jgi:hypothetical protein
MTYDDCIMKIMFECLGLSHKAYHNTMRFDRDVEKRMMKGSELRVVYKKT